MATAGVKQGKGVEISLKSKNSTAIGDVALDKVINE